MDEYFEKTTKDALAVASLPSDSLFFVDKSIGEANLKTRKKFNSVIPAVEVEPPGCSFNPPFEAHQDSLAQAVADEMQKVYRKELGPEPVPLEVMGEIIDEEDKFFLDADDGNENDLSEDNATDELLEERQRKTKRVTRVEQNRRARRKEQLKAETEAKRLEYLSKEIDWYLFLLVLATFGSYEE